MNFDKTRVKELLKSFMFEKLFLEEIGWDQLILEPQYIEIKEETFILNPIAHKKGVQVFLCEPDKNGFIPIYEKRKKIDTKVYKFAHEHLIIFINQKKTKQIWMWVARDPNKPTAYRQIEFNIYQSGEELIQKLQQITFTIDEEESISLFDVTKKLKDAMDKDRVTKKFYDRFKKEHDDFLKKILGISKIEDAKWYASLLLNRLMFIYFIQKKGFLDNDLDYLKNRMERMKNKFGNDKFYSFYRYFLLKLFHYGLGSPQRNPELEKLVGKIPYLNGGLFDVHKLEKEYEDIQITDEAFEKIFAFFDAYHWHLDNRPIVKGNEVNPDVVGYIFEKYINQKQMGAYYTKEDITDYISKNTIIPFLFNQAKKYCKIAFIGENNIWKILQENPDRYFYDAVKKGCDLELPEEIEIGIDPNKPNLFERRKNWNKLADEEYALPTEIWREVVARRQRYFEVKEKIENGEINSINDLITYSLNIRQFIQDVIDNAEGPELIKAFYKAATEVSVLDPTCGSGAFLFAALNILEEIYEALIERMESFVFDLENSKEKFRSDKFKDFKEILAEINKHTSRKYFIYKSIVINNLYGVDIMDEAIEIAKLRLFLKLASVCEKDDKKPNMGIEPLPDIDFHLKAGNTLVGFTDAEQVREICKNDIRNIDYVDELEEQLQIIEKAFNSFHEMQKLADYDENEYHQAKEQLETKLTNIRNRLNHFLAEDYGKAKNFEKFLETHKPFHWFLEFYQIMNSGGFDVIIGNPPYVEYSKVKKEYQIKGFETESCGNLYAFIIERSIIISSNNCISMIIPSAAWGVDGTKELRIFLKNNISELFVSYFSGDAHPSILFEGVKLRLSIFISLKAKEQSIKTTGYLRWYAEQREILFKNLMYTLSSHELTNNCFPKLHSKIDLSIINNIISNKNSKINIFSNKINDYIAYYHNAPVFFIRSMNFIPFYEHEKNNELYSNHFKYLYLLNEEFIDFIICLLNSSLFYFWFTNYSANRDLTIKDIYSFPIISTKNNFGEFNSLINKLMEDIKNNSVIRIYKYKTGTVKYQEFYMRKSKPIIDEIDKVLAQHYGFTDEELDFIINYDIKYRMGKDWLKR